MKNKKNARRALFMSVMAMILCMAMLVGTTFAWFTDSVSSGKNQIVAGNLDVELYYQVEGQSDWTKVTADTNVFMENALWEPGHTEVVRLKVVNEGTLALKYQLGVNVAGETGSVNKDGQSFLLSDYIKFGIVDGADSYDRDAAVAAVDATATPLKNAYSSDVITLLPYAENSTANEKIVTLVVYMPTSVGNEANYGFGQAVPTISLGINLYATQVQNETDSFGNDYDEYAENLPKWDGTVGELPEADENNVITITTASELAAVANAVNGGAMTYARDGGRQTFEGYTIVLANDINLANMAWMPIGSNGDDQGFMGTFDGQGHTIYNLRVNQSSRDYQSAGLFGSLNGTVKNVSVVNASIYNLDDAGNTSNGAAVIAGSSQFGAVIENVHVKNASVTGNRRVSAIAGYFVGRISNCSVNNTNLTAIFDNLGNGEYDNCDKVGAIIAYSNGTSTISGNQVSNVTLKGYRDIGGIAGYASTSSILNNSVSDLAILVDKTHDYKGYGEEESKYDANPIVGEGSADESNSTNNVTSTGASSSEGGMLFDGQNTYYIYDAADLKAFADEVNKYSNYEKPFEGKTVLLMNDIDLGGMEWTPIGDYRFSANRFCGTFDGQGHTISNFKISKKTDKNDSNKSSYGFFGNMEGTVKNLTVSNANVVSYAYTGALIGRLNSGTVINCHVRNSSVECTYWQAGGMFGQINGSATVTGCTVTNTTVTGASALGALAGPVTADAGSMSFTDCTVKNCAVVQKGGFGGSYDNYFAAGFGYLEASAGTEITINNVKVEKTTVKGATSTELSGDYEGLIVIDGTALVSNAADLVAAVNGVKDGETVRLIADIENADGILISDRKITIDLNGHTFTVTEGASTNNRNFKIIGASEVTIKNGTLIADGTISSGAYGTVRTESGAKATLVDLELYSYRGYGLNVKALTGSSIIINNCEIYAQYSGGVEAAGGEIVLNDTKIEQSGVDNTGAWCSVAIGVNGGGSVTVNSGSYSAAPIATDSNAAQGTWVAYVMSSGGTLDIKGGTFNGTVAETAAAANACGLICADRAAVVNITGGTFNSNGAILDMRNNVGTQPNPVATLAGGTFSADPRISGLYSSNLITVAANCEVIANADGTWTVG